MKRILLSALIGVGMVALLFPRFSGSEAARTPEDYQLVCRGGGSLVTGIAPGEGNIGFTFVRGTKPAGEGLAPGECSWKDRGMYPNEPDRVSQHVEEGSDSLKEGGTLAPENRWYEELHSSDKYWTFMVSNNGKGQLIATSARPNKEINVSPTARVPSKIEQILRPDLPRARALDDETPKLLVLNAPAAPGSFAGLMKGSPIARDMDTPPAPPPFTTTEKTALLKAAGLEAFDEKTPPYVRLTPQQPQVVGRGVLTFVLPMYVTPDANLAIWRNPLDDTTSSDVGYPSGLIVSLKLETAGIYLMTFTVRASVSSSYNPVEFVITAYSGIGSKQTFLGKKTEEWQRLNMIVEVAKPGQYNFTLEAQGKNLTEWSFSSCEVTAWKK